MWKILLYGLLIWFLYNLVFRFIIPIYRTSKQMKKKFREMHEQMQERTAGQQANDFTQRPRKDPQPQQKGDYIDFEEIK